MPSLRIAVIPDLPKALHTAQEEKDALLRSACETIGAQKIAGIKFGFSAAMQCVLWVSGSLQAIGTLQTYLTRQGMSYEFYDGTPSDSAIPEEGSQNGKNPLTKQSE